MVLAKYEVEAALFEEKQAISTGKLKEDNPLDDSEGFLSLCEGCRRGDLKLCQERIQEGVNINARDRFDYTPLTLVGGFSIGKPFSSITKDSDPLSRPVFADTSKLYNYCSSLELFASGTPSKASAAFITP